MSRLTTVHNSLNLKESTELEFFRTAEHKDRDETSKRRRRGIGKGRVSWTE